MSQTPTGTDHSTKGAYVTGGEEFTRDTDYIEDRITRETADDAVNERTQRSPPMRRQRTGPARWSRSC